MRRPKQAFSEEDAVLLLRRRLDDDIPVSLLILALGLTAILVGFISTIDDSSFSVIHLTKNVEKAESSPLNFRG